MNNETYLELKKIKEKHELLIRDINYILDVFCYNKYTLSDPFINLMRNTIQHSEDVLTMIDIVKRKVDTLSYLCKENLDLIKYELTVNELQQVEYFIKRMKDHPSMKMVKEFIHSLDKLFSKYNYNADKYGEFLNKIGFGVVQIEDKGEYGYVLQFPTITKDEELSMGYIHCLLF